MRTPTSAEVLARQFSNMSPNMADAFRNQWFARLRLHEMRKWAIMRGLDQDPAFPDAGNKDQMMMFLLRFSGEEPCKYVSWEDYLEKAPGVKPLEIVSEGEPSNTEKEMQAKDDEIDRLKRELGEMKMRMSDAPKRGPGRPKKET